MYGTFEKVTLCDDEAEIPVTVDGKPRTAVAEEAVNAVLPQDLAGQLTLGFEDAWLSGGSLCWYYGDTLVTQAPAQLKGTGGPASGILIGALCLLLALGAALAVLARRQRRRAPAAPTGGPPIGRDGQPEWRKENTPDDDRFRRR